MPRLYLSHAGAATLARVRADVPADLAAELLQRAAREPRRSVADAGWPAGAQRYRDLLAASAPVSWEARGPIYRAAHTLAAPPGVVAINAGNAELLRPLLPHAMFAVDRQYVGDASELDAGREIALIPPVSGG